MATVGADRERDPLRRNSDNDDLFEDTPKKSLPSIFGGQAHAGAQSLPYHSGGPSSSAPYDTRHSDFLSSSQGSSPGRGPIPTLTGTGGFDFDEDDEVQIRERQQRKAELRKGKRRLKDAAEQAWDKVLDVAGMGKPKDLQGERTIHINDSMSNDQYKYMNNYVSTGKYNLVTFIPKFLAGECFTLCLLDVTASG